ncbi:MAG: AAA family ATPase [Methylococcales bacterium]
MNNASMSTDEKETTQLRDQVVSEMEVNKLSQSRVSSESGIGKARLNQWLKGSYTGNNQEINQQVTIWLDSRKKRNQEVGKILEKPTWTETVTGKRILTTLDYAQVAADICCIYGGAGVGKTFTCRHHAENNPNVWVATMTSATSGVAASLEQIAIAIGLKNYPGRASRLARAIAEKLKNTNGLLIIDEAQHLSKQALEVIRSLHDESDIGVALVGNEIVFSQMTGGGARSEGFAQLFSRIGKRVRLTKPVDGDVEPLAQAWGISDKKVIQELISIAGKPGALRGLTKTIRLGAMFAVGKNVDLGLAEIKAASRDLGIS